MLFLDTDTEDVEDDQTGAACTFNSEKCILLLLELLYLATSLQATFNHLKSIKYIMQNIIPQEECGALLFNPDRRFFRSLQS